MSFLRMSTPAAQMPSDNCSDVIIDLSNDPLGFLRFEPSPRKLTDPPPRSAGAAVLAPMQQQPGARS